LPALLAAKFIYSQKAILPSDEEDKEFTSESVQEVTNRYFEVFHCLDIPSTSQVQPSTAVGFEKKTPDLLALLTAHAGGSSPAVVVTRPPTPAAKHTSPADAGDKKRKRAQGGKGTEGTDEGEISHSSHQPPAKESRMGKGQSKKLTLTGTSKEVGGDQSRKASIWRPNFALSSGTLVLDDANLRDTTKGSSGLVAECLEKALCLPKDMEELRSFRKRKVFLALKQDFAKVCKHSFLTLWRYSVHKVQTLMYLSYV